MKHKAYKFRLYPNKKQQELLAKTFGSARFVYNRALKKWQEDYKNKITSSRKTLNADLTALKRDPEFIWLNEVDSIALQSSIFDLHDAYQRFFKRLGGRPNLKRKGVSINSYTTKFINNNIEIINRRLIKLPRLGSVKFRQSRKLNGRIINATLSQNKSGKYYVSLLVEEQVNHLPKTNSNLGIDLGLTHFVIFNDGSKIDHPKHLEKLLLKLKREQRKLSRRREIAIQENRPLDESMNYQKQRLVVARLHERIQNQRMDFLHKLSTEIVKNHDEIFVEDLKVSKMVKNKQLARYLSQSGFTTFVNLLEYKSDWYGKTLQKVGQFFPSTKLCSNCKFENDRLELSDRTWICPNCGTNHDRDINAANNILNEGIRLLNLQLA